MGGDLEAYSPCQKDISAIFDNHPISLFANPFFLSRQHGNYQRAEIGGYDEVPQLSFHGAGVHKIPYGQHSDANDFTPVSLLHRQAKIAVLSYQADGVLHTLLFMDGDHFSYRDH